LLYRVVQNVFDILNRLGIDRQTDGRTDGRTDGTALAIAWFNDPR